MTRYFLMLRLIIGRSASPNLSLRYNVDCLSKYQRLAMPIFGHLYAGTAAAESTNITNIINAINSAAANGSDCCLMLHRGYTSNTNDATMGGAGGIGIRVSDAILLANAIESCVSAGTLKALLMSDIGTDCGTWTKL